MPTRGTYASRALISVAEEVALLLSGCLAQQHGVRALFLLSAAALMLLAAARYVWMRGWSEAEFATEAGSCALLRPETRGVGCLLGGTLRPARRREVAVPARIRRRHRLGSRAPIRCTLPGRCRVRLASPRHDPRLGYADEISGRTRGGPSGVSGLSIHVRLPS